MLRPTSASFRRVSDPETGTVGGGVIIGRYGVMADGSAV